MEDGLLVIGKITHNSTLCTSNNIRINIMFKYLYPFMLTVAGVGFISIVYNVYMSMWATDALTVVCVGLVFTAYWTNMVLDYFDVKTINKMLDNR